MTITCLYTWGRKRPGKYIFNVTILFVTSITYSHVDYLFSFCIEANLTITIMFRTPLHADVFTSYSWSANIVGRKRWLLFPPHEENHFRDLYGQLAYDAVSEELNDHTKYKMYDSTKLKCFDVTQEAGEIIFVPSGWHHQVWNLVNRIVIEFRKRRI